VVDVIQDILVGKNSVRILVCILLLIVLVQGVFAEAPCTLIKTWGAQGGGSNTTANGIALDSSDNVYVTDTGNHRVQTYLSTGSIIAEWGNRGTETPEFDRPWGIAVDSSHDVYFTDNKNDTVLKFTSRGSQVWGSEGSGNGQFDAPTGIAVDRSGNVYVADTGNDRIQIFHSTGTYLMQWGSNGTLNGHFNAPEGIAVDSSGTMYVADTGNHRIQKISPTGTVLAKWGSEGTGNGQFNSPAGIALDSWGNVYVADLTSRLQKFSPAGEYLSTCDTGGMTRGVAIDSSGYIYALWQSGPPWKIGIYKTPSSIPTQTPAPALASRPTRFEITTPVVPATSQNIATQTKIPAIPTTGLTTAPATAPVVSPVLTPATDDNATMAAPVVEVTIRNTGTQENILDTIAGFFRGLFTTGK